MKDLRSVLLVDDDPQDIELILNALDINIANDILVLRDGVEVLDYLYQRGEFSDRSDGNPVLILLDLKMPRMDGIEVLRQLKSDLRMHTIPVVILTSSRESKDLETCYQLGVNAYVVKPVNFLDFVKAVKEIGIFWALINETPPDSVSKE